MRAGALRHRLQLQSATSANNSCGEPVLTWTTYDTVWGQVKPIGGEERERAQQVEADVTHQVTIRYLSTVTPDHQILYDSRYFKIHSAVNKGERDRRTVMLCSEVV
ncbi:MAG: phage head closure protein [FCB group bacterium]|nr:phage head closure protein [FCB group bacterium]